MPAKRKYAPICSVDTCDKPHSAHGLCSSHAKTVSRGGTLTPTCTYLECKNLGIPAVGKKHKYIRCEQHTTSCMVAGCSVPRAAQYCAMHEKRIATTGTPGPIGRLRREMGTGTDWYMNDQGYIVKVNNFGGVRTTIRQHTEVMEEYLGRKLLPRENVHHRNGIRHDNRIENLELWVVRQPRGARATDLLAWAEQIIDQLSNDKPKLIELERKREDPKWES